MSVKCSETYGLQEQSLYPAGAGQAHGTPYWASLRSQLAVIRLTAARGVGRRQGLISDHSPDAFGGKLDSVEAGVLTISVQQLVVGAALDDAAVLEYENDVRAAHRREAVGDRD